MGSRGNLLNVTNPNPSIPQSSPSFFTYSSPPRPLKESQRLSRRSCSKVLKPRGIHDYFNIMWDPHIRRGNPGAGIRVQEVAEIRTKISNESTQVKVKKKRFTASNYGRRRNLFPSTKCPSTPPPVQGRYHNLAQTDPFVEYLSGQDLDVVEVDANIQTDLGLADEPLLFSSHDVPVAIKTGVDASTQIFVGELLDFEDEVQPILASLVGKVLEESLMETMEEEELAALQEQKNRFRQRKEIEEEQLRSLQAQLEHLRTERVQLRTYLEAPASTGIGIGKHDNDTNSFDRVPSASPMYTTSDLLELLPSVLNSLKQEGFIQDNVGDDVLSTFVSNMNTKPTIENINSTHYDIDNDNVSIISSTDSYDPCEIEAEG